MREWRDLQFPDLETILKFGDLHSCHQNRLKWTINIDKSVFCIPQTLLNKTLLASLAKVMKHIYFSLFNHFE